MSNDALNRKGWYTSAGSAAGGESPEGEGQLPAHAAPGAEGKWGHALSRRGGSAHKAHLPPRISWSTKPGGLNIPENMPKGGTLSPGCGNPDLGELRGEEVFHVFENPIKIPKKQTMRASDAIPLKEKSKR